jgi:glutamate racemase
MDPRADSPIGVFDSGVGGLTVLDECLARLPAEDFLYFGDTAWFPYGDKSADQLRGRAEAIGNWLIAKGAKLVVVACNTATAAALAHLQTHLDVPVIGVMTAESHAAVQSSRSRRIGHRGIWQLPAHDPCARRGCGGHRRGVPRAGTGDPARQPVRR